MSLRKLICAPALALCVFTEVALAGVIQSAEIFAALQQPAAELGVNCSGEVYFHESADLLDGPRPRDFTALLIPCEPVHALPHGLWFAFAFGLDGTHRLHLVAPPDRKKGELSPFLAKPNLLVLTLKKDAGQHSELTVLRTLKELSPSAQIETSRISKLRITVNQVDLAVLPFMTGVLKPFVDEGVIETYYFPNRYGVGDTKLRLPRRIDSEVIDPAALRTFTKDVPDVKSEVSLNWRLESCTNLLTVEPGL